MTRPDPAKACGLVLRGSVLEWIIKLAPVCLRISFATRQTDCATGFDNFEIRQEWRGKTPILRNTAMQRPTCKS